MGRWGLNVSRVARDGTLTSRATINTGDSGSIRLLMDVGEPLLDVSSGMQQVVIGRRAGCCGRLNEPREGEGVYRSPPNSELGEGSDAEGKIGSCSRTGVDAGRASSGVMIGRAGGGGGIYVGKQSSRGAGGEGGMTVMDVVEGDDAISLRAGIDMEVENTDDL